MLHLKEQLLDTSAIIDSLVLEDKKGQLYGIDTNIDSIVQMKLSENFPENRVKWKAADPYRLGEGRTIWTLFC